MDTSKMLLNFKQIQLVPTIFLSIILYLFSIDIITAFLLGYQPKDFFSLIDIDRLIYVNATLIVLFTFVAIIVKKSFWGSFAAVGIMCVIYYDLDFEKALNTAIVTIIFIAALSFNTYDNVREYFSTPAQHVISFISGLILMLITIGFVSENIDDWINVELRNDKIELTKHSSMRLLVKTKSLNVNNLQPLYSDLKVYMNSQISYDYNQQLFDTNNSDKNFLEIPHDGAIVKGNMLTVNYYDVDNYKNLFIVNPASCEDNKCELHTLITKMINENNPNNGYALISKYTQTIELQRQ